MSAAVVVRRLKRALAILAVAGGAAGVLLLVLDDGIVTTVVRKERGIRNGSAFDVASLPVSAPCIVLPARTRVRPGEPGVLRLHMEKGLMFLGFPPQPVTPEMARRNMGCAWRAADGCLEIDVFGEWGGLEGGAGIALIAEVPDGVEVRLAPVDRPPGGAAAHPASVTWSGDHLGRPDWWYEPPEPAPGWTRIADRPAHFWERSVWRDKVGPPAPALERWH